LRAAAGSSSSTPQATRWPGWRRTRARRSPDPRFAGSTATCAPSRASCGRISRSVCSTESVRSCCTCATCNSTPASRTPPSSVRWPRRHERGGDREVPMTKATEERPNTEAGTDDGRGLGETYVYFFGEGRADGNARMRDVLGGKGAGLAEMSNAGVPVPPGFTITTAVCRWYYAHGRELPQGFEDEQARALERLEELMGKELGDPSDPLLVSVRS